MKYPHTRPAALAAMWARGMIDDEWEIIEEVRRLHRAGESVHAGLQQVFNEIMLAAAERAKLPAKQRGKKAMTDPRELPAAVAYLKALSQGVGAYEATKAATEVFPGKDDRTIARYVRKHKHMAGSLIAAEDAREIAAQRRKDAFLVIARVRAAEALGNLPAIDADKAAGLLAQIETLGIAELDQFIERKAGDDRRAAYFKHLSAQTGDPVADYAADVCYTIECSRIDSWEVQALDVLQQRAAGARSHVTERARARRAELLSDAREPGDG